MRCLSHSLSLFALSSLFAVALGCGSDDPTTSPPGSDAGSDALSDATDEVSDQDAPSNDAPNDVSPDAGSPRLALFVASDYVTTAELVAVDLDTHAIAGSMTSDDQDTLVDADGNLVFLIHRTVGQVTVIDPAAPSTALRTVDVNPPSGIANPWDVVVPAGEKAYVVRYGQNSLVSFDPHTGAMLGEIDLSAYVADPDGLVDAFAGVFDPVRQVAYVGLQRVDQNEFGDAPDYVNTCSATKAAIVAIDTATDTIIDLNGSSPGELLEIEAVNPWRLAWDAVENRIIAFGIGCAVADADAGPARRGRGVEAIDPLLGSTAWLWQTDALDRPAELVWLTPSEAWVALDDDAFTRHWYKWNPSQTTLGDEMTGLPDVPVWDGDRGFIGLATSTSGGLDVVRYDLDEGTTAPWLQDAFATPGVFPASSAVAR